MLTIRRAKFGDELGIHKAHMRSIQEICANHYTPEQIAVWSNEFNETHRRNSIANLWTWVIELEGVISGFAIFGKTIDQEQDAGSIRALYLCPEITRQGAGKKLVAEMEELALKLGWKTLVLESTRNAVKFYISCGFVQIEGEKELIWSGVSIPCFPMRKRL